MADLRLKKLIEEVQQYEKQRERIAQCGKSTVQAVNCLVLNGITHAGIVSHVCTSPSSHIGDCMCMCGHHWKGMER